MDAARGAAQEAKHRGRFHLKSNQKRPLTLIPAEMRTLCTLTDHTHTHAHVHLHSEANPFSKVEVRFSQIHRGCRNNIHQHYKDQTTPSRPPRVKGQFFGTQ